MMSSGRFRSITPHFTLVWLKGQKRSWVLSAAVYTLIFSLLIFLKGTDPAYQPFLANLGYLPLGFFSVICAIYAANQKELNPRTRLAWQLVALGLILSVFADILRLGLQLTRGIGFPDLPDFFSLVFYPLIFLGLITVPSEFSDPGQKKAWKLDIAIIITGFTAILWYFIIAPTAASRGENWLASLVAAAYPAMDVLLLAGVASVLFRRPEINTRSSLLILGLGLSVFVFADIAHAWLILQGSYRSGSRLDILWTISYFFIGLAALRQATPYLDDSLASRKTRASWLTSLPPFLVVIASAITVLFAARNGTGAEMRTDGLYFGTLLVLFLTMARQLTIMRENSRLVEELNFASNQLRNSAQSLERRVQERTRELESQTNRLRLAAQIARDTTSARDLNSLLKRSTALILERFNLYHTAIFLLDQQREYAVLAASPTEAGQQMMVEGYKLRIRAQEPVAQAAATGEPITILEGSFGHHPLLPHTRSEMALPLKVEGNLIGVLDVQSDKPQAFNEDDTAALQILADQLATSVERTLLLERVEQNLRELEQAYGQFTRESWRSFEKSGLPRSTGYRFDNVHIEPITELPAHGNEALSTGKTVVYKNGAKPTGKNLAAIPISLRGKTIGVVTVQLKDGYSQATVSMLEAAIERLATALESARLYEEARMRADRELSISRVTSAISSSTEYEQILQTTVREIGNLLSDTEVAIQILEEPAASKPLERRDR